MGCASSKSKQPICRNCHTPCSPMPRSYSMHTHHPPEKIGDTYHVVTLTSTTLGNLKLEPLNFTSPNEEKNNEEDIEDKFSMGMIEAKTWSKMIEEKIPKIIPKTPLTTPPGEPENIDVSELMQGLEETSPLRPHHLKSFSFHVSRTISNSNSLESSSNSSTSSDFDPDLIATFRKSLEDLPETSPFYLNPIKKKVVLYFTSLRGVRKTYEDCCHVKVMLNGMNLRVDERDVSMHSGFKDELKELLGDKYIGLPRVFIGKKYIGGADEIRKLNEDGILENVFEDCEMVNDNGSGNVCEACGDARFMPCETCSGSCKIYYEEEEQEEEFDEKEEEEDEYGFQRCPDCNENGLVRCPICCD